MGICLFEFCNKNHLEDLLASWHPDKNGKLTPHDLSYGSGKKVWWVCKEGHEWQASVYSRTAGSGCPYCAGRKILTGYNDLATINPPLAKQWHPTKNNGLSPADVTASSGKKVWWICKNGHEWQAVIGNRTKGSGCPYCAAKNTVKGKNDLGTLYPELTAQWHPTKNGSLTPADIMPGSEKKVWWVCENGHEWQAVVFNRKRGIGCPYCSGNSVLKGYNDLATTNPELAKQWHPTKNGKLTPCDVSKGSNQKVWWICEKGHEWQGQINGRRHASCKICRLETGTSYPEQAIYYYLRQLYQAENKAMVGPYEADIFLPEHHIIVEYQGSYFHNRPEQKTADLKKAAYFNTHHYQLITIYDDNRNTDGNPLALSYPYRTSQRYLDALIERLICLIAKLTHHRATIRIHNQRDKTRIMEQYIFLEKKRSLACKNPALAAQWHPTKNGSLKPDFFRNSSQVKVWWACEKGHEWQATISSRTDGSGCPYCAGRKVLKGFNDLATVDPDLAAQWHPTRNGTVTPFAVTCGSEKKAWWICENGHEWRSAVAKRTAGRGCPYCAGRLAVEGINDFATVHPELAKQWHPARNGDLSPRSVTAASGKKVWWVCENGHEWQASICDRSKGHGCPYCANKKVLKGYNDLATVNPKLAKQWHPTKNNGLTAFDITHASGKMVWWICKKGHEWQAAPCTRSKGIGCPYCAGKKAIAGVNDLATVNPVLAKQWHPTKNGSLLPTGVTASSGKKVWWACEKGHEWQAFVYSRSAGNGCPYCSNSKTLKGYNDLATGNPALAKQWHSTKNGSLTPCDVSKGSNQKVWWICQKGHEWQAVISDRSSGGGCPYCANKKVLKGYNDLATINPQLAKQWHPTKNRDLTPFSVTRGSPKKVWWICENKHEWQATIKNRSNGSGCPICSGRRTN